MSEVIRFTSRKDVSWVNADTYPDAGGCNILFLTDRELSIARQFVYPQCLSDRAFVSHIFDQWYTYPSAADRLQFDLDINSLLDKLGTGITMDCQAFLDELAAMAFTSKMQGYHAAGWRNAPVPFGVTTVWVGYVETLALAPGSTTLSFATVAADTILVVTHMAMRYTGTPPTYIESIALVSGYQVRLRQQLAPVSAVWYTVSGQFVLAAGDKLQLLVVGATTNDDLAGRAMGYTISVA